MKKILLLMLMTVSAFALCACKQDGNSSTDTKEVENTMNLVSEESVKDFVIEYKTITHDIGTPTERNITELLEKVKPYLNDEWYEMNEKDKRVNFPRTFANASDNAVNLNDVVINELKENPEEEGYELNYTLLLTIGEEDVEKGGEMKIIEGGSKGFTIIYDWEKQITVDGYHFR